jgi:hypothetical protein
MSGKQTFGEWLDIIADLDGYMAAGGRLLDVEMHGPELPPAMQEMVAERLGKEGCERLGRFWIRVGQLTGDGDLNVGIACTEDEIRTAWRASADPDHKPGVHH